MGEMIDRVFSINGTEIKSISEGELEFNFENCTYERECEIKTTHGTIRFTAVFTEEQMDEFIKVYGKATKEVEE